ncbi:MAG TPA: hypothetical protein VGH11_01680 [Jatrophihabitans sp.]
MTKATSAEALFVSNLQPSDHPSAEQVITAIRGSLADNGGESGCVVAFVSEYGEHPDEAADRMRWALSVVAATDQTGTVALTSAVAA